MLNPGAAYQSLRYNYFVGWYGLTQSYSTAKNYYVKSCMLGDKLGCIFLGDMYVDGLAVRQSYDKAKDYYKKDGLVE